jgi:hypothetical protein
LSLDERRQPALPIVYERTFKNVVAGLCPGDVIYKTALSKSGVAGTSRAMVKMRLREE